MESISQDPFSDVLDSIYEIIPFKSVENYQTMAHELATVTLSHRNLCDLELILNGGFAPLDTFLNKTEYENVLENMHLGDGSIWPMPVTLDVDRRFADSLKSGQEIALRDVQGLLIAIMLVNDVWKPNKKHEALAVYNTLDENHPGVATLLNQVKDYYISGELIPMSSPVHYDYDHLRFTPAQLQETFEQRRWKKIVAFHTHNPMHKVHRELTLQAVKLTGAKLLLHPVSEFSQANDHNHYLRIRCYEHILKTYPKKSTLLGLLPLATRMAGPREALWHAIIRKNYGCTHFIVGRDHASPIQGRSEQKYYRAYDAQTLALTYQNEVGIEIVPMQELIFSHRKMRYYPANKFPKNGKPTSISGTELRNRIINKKAIPEWFTYPDIISELRKTIPHKLQQGFTVLLTGLPNSGKSTIANGLMLKLIEQTGRQVTLLDDNEIRARLSRGLSSSERDKEVCANRVAYVAKEVTRHGGIVVCETPATTLKTRNDMRDMISQSGGFIEVYVSTPMSTCENRNPSGLIGDARATQIKDLVLISNYYEAPEMPEIEIDTSSLEPKEVIENIMKEIRTLGYIE